MSDPDRTESIDAQLSSLRSSISDLGYQVDSSKTKTAAALGLGVFLLLLAGGAAYDLIAGKRGVWLMLGVTREALIWIAAALGCTGIILMIFGFRRVSRPDLRAKAKLEQMEQEYADLVERRNAARRV